MATYYIDESGVDDAGRNGLTIATAWATLSYACTRATTAGDTIMVGVGTFTESAQSVKSVGVSIIGNNVNRPTITTTYVGSLTQPLIKVSSVGQVSVNDNSEIAFINFNGNNLTCSSAITCSYVSNVKIHDCNFDDFKNHAIGFIGTNSVLSTDPPIAVPTYYSLNNKIYNCIITNCTQYDVDASAGAITFRGQNGLEIYDNTLDHGSRAVGLSGDELVGYNNKGVKIYNNKIYRNDYENDQWNFFAEIHNSNGGMELYDNEFYGRSTFDASGSVAGEFGFGWKIYGNKFDTRSGELAADDSHAAPFLDIEAFDVAEDVYIYQNYFKNARTAIALNNCQTSASRIYIYYNIMENIGNTSNIYSGGIQVFSTWGSSTPVPFTDIFIYNNVMNGSGTCRAGIDVSARGDIDNLKIKNNIINGGFAYPLIFNTAVTPTMANLEINNNIFNGNDNNSIYYNVSITYIDRDDTGNLTSDPLFIGGSPYSYALQPNSPAIDAGLDVGLISDIIGTLVPYGSAPDIGAYEWFEVEYDFSNITLVNTPACYNAVDNTIISRWVATECPINFTLLRRDWYITNSSDVGGFLAVNIYGSFTGNDGDVISVYDLTTNSMYTGTITDKSGDPVLITDIPYVAGMDIKYLNDHTLYAGYYFEGRLTINGVVESLTVIASPDSFGYADLDVSGILRIKTSIGKVTNYLSLIQKDTNKSGQFTLEYRGCWYGSNEAWISEGSTTSPASEVIWYYAECVRSEEQGCNLAEYVPTDLNDAPFLNQFDTPVYWYGLPFDLSFILPERAELSPTSDIIVTMKVYNSANVQIGADIVQTIDVDSLEGYVNSLNINSTLIDAGAAYFTVEIFSM